MKTCVQKSWWRASGLAVVAIVSGFNPALAQDSAVVKPFSLNGLAITATIGGGPIFGGQPGKRDLSFGLSLIFPSAGISPRLELSGDFQTGRSSSVQVNDVSGPSLAFGGSGPTTPGGFEQYTSVDESGALALGTLSFGELGAGGLRIEGMAFTPAGLGGAISQYAQSPSASGAALLALATSWNGDTAQGTAAVYAVVMDDAGTLFLGSGDMNATLRHDVSEDFDQRHQSLKLIWPLGNADGWAVFARLGPWLDHMTQQLDQTTTFDITPTVEGAVMATTAMVRADQSRTRSTGLSVGLGAERPITARWSLAAYIDLGKGSYENRHTHSGYSAIYSEFPEITVDQPNADVTEHGTARRGEIAFQMIRKVDAKSAISFGVKGNYHGSRPWLRPTSDGQAVMGHTSDYGWGLSVQYRHWF
jgi:hypothetical protein